MTLRSDTASCPLAVAPDSPTVAGWTGRDAAAVQPHVPEPAAPGEPRPSGVPLHSRGAPGRMTQAGGGPVLGSDEADRGLEAHSLAHSKQVCARPVAAGLWRLQEVADRLDALDLECDIRDRECADCPPCQRGMLAALIAGAPGGLGPDAAMVCGTLPAMGGVRPAAAFGAQLHDPATGRRLELCDQVAPLPVVACPLFRAIRAIFRGHRRTRFGRCRGAVCPPSCCA